MTKDGELTVDELLARHPWPPEHAGERRLSWLWHFDVALPLDEAWRVVADSSRMNRALGVSEMKFEERAGRRWGSSRAGGVRHEWVELPWSWVAGEWLSSVRLYERGFFRVAYAVFRLSPSGSGGTRITTYFGAVPRGLLGWLALRLGFPGLERGFERLWRALEAGTAGVDGGAAASTPMVVPAAPLAGEAEDRLAALARGLVEAGLDPASVERLAAWIRTGDENDLDRIQVRERARAWGLDEDALLRVFLHATRAGMLDLSWDVVCPHCRGVTEAVGKLGALPAHGGCAVCAIDFGTDTAEAVEITFHVHPSIRAVERRTYCSGEPAEKEHVRVQRALAPGAEEVVAPRLAPGRYRTRLQGEKRYGYLDAGEAPADPGEPRAETSWRASAEPATFAAGAAPSIRLINDTGAEQTFVIEAARWSDVALRPGRILSFQEFRDLFSHEYLGADVQLAIGEQTILFTDMVGSTALYARRGDPAAFVEVKRHFAVVFAILAEHRGALVKTIGDAAMGAFNSPLDAVKAARAIHDAFHRTRAESPTRLRISLNTGPAIAVRLNTDIDYFGHTVNVSAKLQALAGSFQIAMSCAVHAAPGVAPWLEAEGATLEDLTYASPAIPEPIGVKRWTVHPADE